MGVLRFDWHAARPAASDVAGVEPVWLHPYSLVPSKKIGNISKLLMITGHSAVASSKLPRVELFH
jgi:hypothetical protein